MKIILTGSSGKIGRAVYIRLCAKRPVARCDVVIYDAIGYVMAPA